MGLSFRNIAFFAVKLCNALRGYVHRYVYTGQYTTNRNYGDALGLWLPQLLGINGGRLLPKRFVFVRQYARGTNIQMVGSTLGDVDEHSVVCGAGAVSADQRAKGVPQKIVSVRGPLTRDILLSQGFDCPAVYGDPAMLLPLLYTPAHSAKKYKIGLIPHYVDKDNTIVQRLAENPDVHCIDILLPRTRGFRTSIERYWRQWIDDLCSCECVVSSSLHGLIIAEAYGIPTLWAKFSDDINGNDFKYYDYYKSINTPPIIIDFRYVSNTDTEFMLKAVTHKDTSAIDKEEYKRLLESIQI